MQKVIVGGGKGRNKSYICIFEQSGVGFFKISVKFELKKKVTIIKFHTITGQKRRQGRNIVSGNH